MKLLIFGPPGSGKGTYASRLAQKLGIHEIVMGDVFREILKEDTPIGREVKKIYDAGGMQSDELTIKLFKKEIEKPEAKKGFIVDGFPRTLGQAKALKKITDVDLIIFLHMPDEILIKKISARRICKKCGEIYNLADINEVRNGLKYVMPPMLSKKYGICDKCGGELIHRPDDAPKVIKERLKVYEEQTKPVAEFLEGKIPFLNVEVTRGVEQTDDIYNSIKKMLKIE